MKKTDDDNVTTNSEGREIYKTLPKNAELIATNDTLKLYKINDRDGAVDRNGELVKVNWYSVLGRGYWKPVENSEPKKKYDISAVDSIKFDAK